MKVNETKSSHITFTLRKGLSPPVSINQTVIPHVETVKYLGLHFDRRLTWNETCYENEKTRSQNTRGKMAHRKKNSPPPPPITTNQNTHV